MRCVLGMFMSLLCVACDEAAHIRVDRACFVVPRHLIPTIDAYWVPRSVSNRGFNLRYVSPKAKSDPNTAGAVIINVSANKTYEGLTQPRKGMRYFDMLHSKSLLLSDLPKDTSLVGASVREEDGTALIWRLPLAASHTAHDLRSSGILVTACVKRSGSSISDCARAKELPDFSIYYTFAVEVNDLTNAVVVRQDSEIESFVAGFKHECKGQ